MLLCKEKQFSHQKVYGRLVKDLLKIEKDGIEIFPNKIVKGSVVFRANDHLGAHFLGGFLENFSTSHYFCRFCLITRQDLWGSNYKKLKDI